MSRESFPANPWESRLIKSTSRTEDRQTSPPVTEIPLTGLHRRAEESEEKPLSDAQIAARIRFQELKSQLDEKLQEFRDKEGDAEEYGSAPSYPRKSRQAFFDLLKLPDASPELIQLVVLWLEKNSINCDFLNRSDVIRQKNELIKRYDENNGLFERVKKFAVNLCDSRRDLLESQLEANPTLVNGTNLFGETLLIYAVKRGIAGAVDLLIRKGADLEKVETRKHSSHWYDWAHYPYEGKTALRWAVELGRVEIARLLIRHQASLPTNLIHLAAYKGHLEIVKALLEKDPDLLNKPYQLGGWHRGGETPLIIAAKQGHTAIVEYLVSQHAQLDVTAVDCEGETALYWAIEKKQTQSAIKLIEAGANPKLEKRGYRPLIHLAVGKEQLEVVQKLVARYPDLCNAVDDFGNTVLKTALNRGNKTIVICLLKNGADPNVIHKRERLPEDAITHLLTKRNYNRGDKKKTFDLIACLFLCGGTPNYAASVDLFTTVFGFMIDQKSNITDAIIRVARDDFMGSVEDIDRVRRFIERVGAGDGQEYDHDLKEIFFWKRDRLGKTPSINRTRSCIGRLHDFYQELMTRRNELAGRAAHEHECKM